MTKMGWAGTKMGWAGVLVFVAAAFTSMSAWNGSAWAQEAPKCSAQTLGQNACFVDKMCECIFSRGGTMTGVPEGYRWDCGIKRPGCSAGADTPATLDVFTGRYPSAVGLDRSRDTTIIRNDNSAVGQGDIQGNIND